MIEIQFTTENQLLKRTDDEFIFDKSRNIVKAEFAVNGDVWDNIDKFAIFSDAFGSKTTVHLGKDSVCSCVVPASCLKTSFFKVALYGGDLVPTNSVTIPLREGGYGKPHHHHHEGSKDIFVEIFEKIDTKIDDIKLTDKSLQIFSDGHLIDSVCIPFVDEIQARNMIDIRIQEFLQTDELDTALKERGYINNVRLVGDELIFE